MSTTRSRQTLPGGEDSLPHEGPSRPPRWWRGGRLCLVLFALAVLIIFAFAQTGVHSERLANPNPRWSYTIDGAPLGARPLWGIPWHHFHNFGVLSIGITVWVVMLVKFKRGRPVQHVLSLIIAGTVLGLQDPFSNFAYSAAFNPKIWHLPSDWPYVRWAPTVEPINPALFGYWSWFLPPALGALWVYRRFVAPRARVGGWWDRHPRAAIFIVGFAVGAVWDIVLEVALLRSMIWSYTQLPPGLFAVAEGHPWQFHVIWGPVGMLGSFGLWPVLLHRDDRGETLAGRWARDIKAFRKRPFLGQTVVTSAIVFVVYMTGNLTFIALRVTHLSTSVARPWPYENTKVYDPQGLYREAGEPGPHFDGSLAPVLNMFGKP